MGMSSPCVNCGADLRVCKECDWYNGVWISKDQYEARLKADMVAMLTEIQLEIEEIEVTKENTEVRVGECCMKGACIDLIQQKINALRGEK